MDRDFEEGKIRLWMSKVTKSIMDKDLHATIRYSILIYNEYFEELDIKNKMKVLLNLCKAYKKLNFYNECMFWYNISIQIDPNGTCQYHYALKWLYCEYNIELGNLNDSILKEYYKCSKYFRKINDEFMRAIVLFNIAKAKQNKNAMFRLFKIAIKENANVDGNITFVKQDNLDEMLIDIKNIDENTYLRALKYMSLSINL